MAIKKPLVLTNGEIEQLQSGDTIDVQPDVFQATYTSAAIPGNCVYIDGSDSVDLANAAATGTSNAIGFANASVSGGSSGAVVFDGLVTLTTAEWDAVAGTAGGLTAGTKYYMSDVTAGAIVSQANITTTATNYVVEIGEALSSTSLEISIRRRIRL